MRNLLLLLTTAGILFFATPVLADEHPKKAEIETLEKQKASLEFERMREELEMLRKTAEALSLQLRYERGERQRLSTLQAIESRLKELQMAERK